jgi:hypothetical protein
MHAAAGQYACVLGTTTHAHLLSELADTCGIPGPLVQLLKHVGIVLLPFYRAVTDLGVGHSAS